MFTRKHYKIVRVGSRFGYVIHRPGRDEYFPRDMFGKPWTFGTAERARSAVKCRQAFRWSLMPRNKLTARDLLLPSVDDLRALIHRRPRDCRFYTKSESFLDMPTSTEIVIRGEFGLMLRLPQTHGVLRKYVRDHIVSHWSFQSPKGRCARLVCQVQEDSVLVMLKWGYGPDDGVWLSLVDPHTVMGYFSPYGKETVYEDYTGKVNVSPVETTKGETTARLVAATA